MSSIIIQPIDIWTAAGVLLGFQVTSFGWRVAREFKRKPDDPTRLPIADIVNLSSMVVAGVGIFVLPVLGLFGLTLMKYAFGLAVLLFVGYPFALAGHCEMYNNQKRSFAYFPDQEKVVIGIISTLGIFYVVWAFIHK